MGIIDTIKSFLNGHDKEVDQLLGKAGDMAKTRFAGHDGQIDGLVGQAREHTGGGDTTASPTPGTPSSAAASPATGAPATVPGPLETGQTPPTGPASHE